MKHGKIGAGCLAVVLCLGTMPVTAWAGTPEFERMYQTLGDIYLTMENQAGEVEHYTRQLDLDNALCTVSYTSGGVDYTRETYSSAPVRPMPDGGVFSA